MYQIISLYIAPGKLQELKATAINKLLSVLLKIFLEALRKLNFANYELFDDTDTAYKNFIQNIMAVTDNLAPSKNKRIKGTSQN